MSYEYYKREGGVPVRAWTRGVPFEDAAKNQVFNVSTLPFIHKHVSIMPDCHMGKGATIGSVIPTKKAIIPAAVGVDLGCGVQAIRTSLTAKDLPDSLRRIRSLIEAAVPHGRTDNGGANDHGGWRDKPVPSAVNAWSLLREEFQSIVAKHPKLSKSNNLNHLGTLGTGNHFIELCLDENDRVWCMLHSGSRGVGNRIGSYFIRLAKEDMKKWFVNLPDQDLAYLPEGSRNFNDYIEAMMWAQRFAKANRKVMMKEILFTLSYELPEFTVEETIDCYHNFCARERHFGENVWVTRKGAVRATKDELVIIPGSMGAASFIGVGLGNRDSFCSCSHGAGRVMSRTEARKTFTIEDHSKATSGVECRKDDGVLDETPAAYKSIEAVMAAQSDLVAPIHKLRQVLCVKG